MFCPNCGNDCGDAKFCSECGTKLDVQVSAPIDSPKKTVPQSIYQPAIINGQEVDLFKVVCKYGVSKERAYSYLKRKFGVSKEQAKELLAPYYTPMDANKTTTKKLFAEATEEFAGKNADGMKRKSELEASGQVYCPKCLSTSVSANQKGFGIGKAVVGTALFGGIGLTAGNIGAKKVICTCLKCGYQWKAGEK